MGSGQRLCAALAAVPSSAENAKVGETVAPRPGRIRPTGDAVVMGESNRKPNVDYGAIGLLAHAIGPEIAELGRIKRSSEFLDFLPEIVWRWWIGAENPDVIKQSCALLTQMHRNGEPFARNLALLSRRLAEPADGDDIEALRLAAEMFKDALQILFRYGTKTEISEMADAAVSAQSAALYASVVMSNWIGSPRPRGRPKGGKYPNLHALVFGLACQAHRCGGKFTVDSKNCKGTMVQAIDVVRNALLNDQLERLASLLPLPGQHPVAAYERTIANARR
jgi:hypothetical protein